MSHIFILANIVAALFCTTDASTKYIQSQPKYHPVAKEALSDIVPRRYYQISFLPMIAAIPALIKTNQANPQLEDPTAAFYNMTTSDEYGIWSFNGSSLASIESKKRSKSDRHNQYTLSFWFRTKQPSVSLVTISAGEEWAAELQLSRGKLYLKLSPNQTIRQTSSMGILNDGKWHKAFLSLNSSHALFGSDSKEGQTTVAISELNNFNFYTERQTAISNVVSGYNLISFIGCIKDLRIDGILIPPKENETVILRNVETQCKFKDCKSNPCKNRGTCVNIDEKPQCFCERGFDGENCQNSSTSAVFNFNNSKSPHQISLPYSVSLHPFQLSMLVSTNVAQGSIFFISNDLEGEMDTYIQAIISPNGKMIVRYKLNACYPNKDVTEQISVNKLVSDGKRHIISIQLANNYFLVSVDDTDTIRFTPEHCLLKFLPMMNIGGKPTDMTDVHKSHSPQTRKYNPHREFKGIIQDIRVRWYNTLFVDLEIFGFNPSKCGFKYCNVLDKLTVESVVEYSNNTDTSNTLHELKPSYEELAEIAYKKVLPGSDT